MNANINPEILGMTAATMGKDLLGFLVQEFKAMPDVWQKLPEHKQNEVIERATRRVESVVGNAVHLLMSEGRTAVVADIEGIAIKDEIKATLKISKLNSHESRNELFENAGQACLIVISNPKDFTGGMDEVKGEPDQRGFDLGGAHVVDAEFEELGAPIEPHDGDAYDDPVYDKAKELVIAEQRPSATFLEELLGIDGDRASALIDRMEEEGIVSAKDANGARTVLVEAPADPDEDPLYKKAVAWVVENQIATISHLQRHLKVGYNRAARLIEQMEKDGIVTAMQGNGTREVLRKNEGDE